MEREPTELEKGIIVKIDPIQLEILKKKSGFLNYENYFDSFKEIAIPGEVGRFLIFRFVLE